MVCPTILVVAHLVALQVEEFALVVVDLVIVLLVAEMVNIGLTRVLILVLAVELALIVVPAVVLDVAVFVMEKEDFKINKWF